MRLDTVETKTFSSYSCFCSVVYLAFALLAAVDRLGECCNLLVDESIYLRVVNDWLLSERMSLIQDVVSWSLLFRQVAIPSGDSKGFCPYNCDVQDINVSWFDVGKYSVEKNGMEDGSE